MKTECVILLGLVAVALASEPAKETSYAGGAPHHQGGARYGYHGKYPGKCGNDGFYMNDAHSFVICSNGNAYVQPCAPGTRNNPTKFNPDSYYSQSDFCNENLNDYGYGARHHVPTHGGGYYQGGYPYGFYGNPYYNHHGGYPYYW